MKVLDELLDWSVERPIWQRDALRRLVVEGELSENDIRDLTEVCKATHGLAEQEEFHPLTKADIPTNGGAGAAVSLTSIYHHQGVNALAERQTLTFAPNLTVVYGNNAAGKTGYIRILKRACRARHREEILGNVVSGASPLSPKVAIKYRVGDEEEMREWAGQSEDDFISRVSVFDTQSATVYLTERTDVAFRPFGLDLFDKLVQACKAIRAQLEKEQRSLSSSKIVELQAKIAQGTSVSKLLSNITSLTSPDKVRSLCALSDGEKRRSRQIERSLTDLQASDPDKLIRELKARVGRVNLLSDHIAYVEKVLSAEAVAKVLQTRAEWRSKRDEADKFRKTTFPKDLLDGTGSEMWATFWEVARQFSEEKAYPSETFPVTRDDSRCVLCQQDFDHATRQRLEKFEAFVRSTTEQELKDVRYRFTELHQNFVELKVRSPSIMEILEDLKIENEDVGLMIADWLTIAEGRRSAIIAALSEDRELEDIRVLDRVVSKVETIVGELQSRIQTLLSNKDSNARALLIAENDDLRARSVLAEYESVVLEEIDRKKRLAAYGLCIDDTRTQAITRKSGSITKKVVTERLRESFQNELSKLGFQHVEVELTDAGGVEGVLYHKIVLSRAPGVELPKVVSEGEQRCLSIAAFFAELSTAEDSSGIVLDDPVSSLDYRWRESVARRLVEEAKNRQVVVFTHDVVFLLSLKNIAHELDVNQADQHILNMTNGAGVCIEELPWVALKVDKRIGYLKQKLQQADKLHRQGHKSLYETEASVIYGLLREAWERGIEEVLLGGVVERFRPGVQTLQVGDIADITYEDCKAVERAMTKCSKWLAGHDQAAAAPSEMPEPSEIRSDIENLSKWAKAIHKRRN